MASTYPSPSQDSEIFEAPTLALKQALCYSCWDVSSNLNRCGACKRVSYCSKECQIQDWHRNHKTICKKLIVLNNQKVQISSVGRKWDDYYGEQIQMLKSNAPYPCELGMLINHEPYCYHCYRSASQIGDSGKLNHCQSCILTSFCSSCPQTHPSTECAILQDLVADEKVTEGFERRTGQGSIMTITQLPKHQYLSLSSMNDWYDYYTKLSDKDGFRLKMNRDLKSGTNTTTIQLTLMAALEETIPDISTRSSITIHIVGPGGAEASSMPAFEEVLHLFPSLQTLELSFIGLNVFGNLDNDSEAQIPQDPQPLKCCAKCTKAERKITYTYWKGPYHSYIDAEDYKTPDLAAAFNSGFAVDERENWYPTIKYFAHAPHPTLFTAARHFEIEGEEKVWKELGAEFVRKPEVNKWKGMSPLLGLCGEKPNEVHYQNYWWYIVKSR
ncbi:hypothetical protein EAF04_004791 [Stromatinia cepivora]|nr:hypothetical protein EAF04_004791 [Stromatinia cepivora]